MTIKNSKYSLLFIILWIIAIACLIFLWKSQNETTPETTTPDTEEDYEQYIYPLGEKKPDAIAPKFVAPKTPTTATYMEVNHGCWPSLEAECVVAYANPSLLTGVPVKQLRQGVVLKVGETIENEDGIWHKVSFEDEWIRYADRVRTDWYIHDNDVTLMTAFEPQEMVITASNTVPTTTKMIIVDRSDQLLTAYEGDRIFMQQAISTGLEITPTPRGMFPIYKKMPSRYMQGPLPGISAKYYDLPGVSWNLYFTQQGGAIHGTYWHNSFGGQYSSGCVNVPLDKAKQLYDWAELGVIVWVRD